MTIVLTKELIESAASPAGGYSRRQLEALGVNLPKGTFSPPKGWKRRLIGKEISQAQYAAFQAATAKSAKNHSEKRNKRANQ